MRYVAIRRIRIPGTADCNNVKSALYNCIMFMELVKVSMKYYVPSIIGKLVNRKRLDFSRFSSNSIRYWSNSDKLYKNAVAQTRGGTWWKVTTGKFYHIQGKTDNNDTQTATKGSNRTLRTDKWV